MGYAAERIRGSSPIRTTEGISLHHRRNPSDKRRRAVQYSRRDASLAALLPWLFPVMLSSPIERRFRGPTSRAVVSSFLAVILASAGGTALASQTPEAKLEFFEKKVRPILVSHCYACHSADTKPSGGLRVDDRNGLIMGGNAGPAVIAGDPTKGLLLERILHTDPKKRMPKEGDLLTESEVNVLKTWITDGAVWPHKTLPTNLGRLSKQAEELKATHWAWQPLSEPQVPEVKDATWPRSNIDRFILATLEEKKLRSVRKLTVPRSFAA